MIDHLLYAKNACPNTSSVAEKLAPYLDEAQCPIPINASGFKQDFNELLCTLLLLLMVNPKCRPPLRSAIPGSNNEVVIENFQKNTEGATHLNGNFSSSSMSASIGVHGIEELINFQPLADLAHQVHGVNVNNNDAVETQKIGNMVKNQWTSDEDRLLVGLVKIFGVKEWTDIANMLKRRTGKQCRERWVNHLRPGLKKDAWTEEEDKILVQAHSEMGNKWAKIAKRLPGRSEVCIKNHLNAVKRRKLSQRRWTSSKYPKPSSILQEYVKNLSMDSKTPPPVEASERLESNPIVDNIVSNEDFLIQMERNTTLSSLIMPCSPPEAIKEIDIAEMISQSNFGMYDPF